jgi:hypothetical protein
LQAEGDALKRLQAETPVNNTGQAAADERGGCMKGREYENGFFAKRTHLHRRTNQTEFERCGPPGATYRHH